MVADIELTEIQIIPMYGNAIIKQQLVAILIAGGEKKTGQEGFTI